MSLARCTSSLTLNSLACFLSSATSLYHGSPDLDDALSTWSTLRPCLEWEEIETIVNGREATTTNFPRVDLIRKGVRGGVNGPVGGCRSLPEPPVVGDVGGAVGPRVHGRGDRGGGGGDEVPVEVLVLGERAVADAVLGAEVPGANTEDGLYADTLVLIVTNNIY